MSLDIYGKPDLGGTKTGNVAYATQNVARSFVIQTVSDRVKTCQIVSDRITPDQTEEELQWQINTFTNGTHSGK